MEELIQYQTRYIIKIVEDTEEPIYGGTLKGREGKGDQWSLLSRRRARYKLANAIAWYFECSHRIIPNASILDATGLNLAYYPCWVHTIRILEPGGWRT